MSTAYVNMVNDGFTINNDDEVIDSIFTQYERVIIESIITSFGLDFLVNDKHGGDVDTIHNVRQIGIDEKMTYKNIKNEMDYQNNSQYDSHSYHSHENYIKTNREAKNQKINGQLKDEYTGKTFAKNEKTNLDHVISAKEIHEDKGRILAGLKGEDLANSPENLRITNEHTNKSKKADSMSDFLNKKGNEYTEEEKQRMLEHDKNARKANEHKIFVTYYTSPKFLKDTAISAGKVGFQMGMRQTLGLVFTEIWFSVKEEFQKINDDFKISELFQSISEGIKKGFIKAKEKFGELMKKFFDGAIAGALSSITTTLTNMFFTTAKSAVRIIRQTWASLVEAINILLFNPDRLLIGDRIKAATKVLAVGASIVAGTMVNEALVATGIATIPVVGEIIPTFCGTLVTGILSCSLLYIMDRGNSVQGIIKFLNNLPTMDKVIDYYKAQADRLVEYSAKLQSIDVESFIKESAIFHEIALHIDFNMQNAEAMNSYLVSMYKKYNISLPWQGDFDNFMSNRNNKLVFC